eukprot:jgi/Chlat1/6198/Chrsp44S05744
MEAFACVLSASVTLERLQRPKLTLRRGTHTNRLLIQRSSNHSCHSSGEALRARCYTGDTPPLLVVIGGGAAGVFGALRAKELCPALDVTVLEKGAPLSKVKVSGGGRCNVTTGLPLSVLELAGKYPRGHKELRGKFFRTYGPADTAEWFVKRGVQLKTEVDGRMFPITDSSSTIIDCLLCEAQRLNVRLQTGTSVGSVTKTAPGFGVSITSKSRNAEPLAANYVLLASGSAVSGHRMAELLGHTIVPPCPSLFTFCINDPKLTALAGTSFPHVTARLQVAGKKAQQQASEGPLLISHWGLTGPCILKLSAWAARELHDSMYKAELQVDFVPILTSMEISSMLFNTMRSAQGCAGSFCPSKLALTRRFWCYVLESEGIDPTKTWRSMPEKVLKRVAEKLKRFPFAVTGKGVFKDEFVTAGGVTLKEVNMNTMESTIVPGLYFAGEVVNIDGITGGFNFQNAWTGGHIAGTAIATHTMEQLQLSLAHG